MSSDDQDPPQRELSGFESPRPAKGKSRFQKLVANSVAIQQTDAWEANEVGYLNRVMVQATLPYKNPPEHLMTWGRTAGSMSLSIMRGHYRTADGKEVLMGFPYGTKPRLVLAWLGREVKLRRSREIHFGNSLTNFMRELGYETLSGGANGNITQVRMQMARLFAARITLTDTRVTDTGKGISQGYMNLVDSQQIWWDPASPDESGSLKKSFIRLTEPFYEELLNHSVPVDMRALKALKGSPLHLDIYCWLAYRLHHVSRETMIPWESLMAQFGTENTDVRKFRYNVRLVLDVIRLLYPNARVDAGQTRGIILKPSTSAIARLVAPNPRQGGPRNLDLPLDPGPPDLPPA